ncbi:MAG TPA: OmpH family outer membrane protein [Pyrinomonadaceae bacterium]|nr:OmpH family outer membrane protein [Pyrinomonadaceae bacterium]
MIKKPLFLFSILVALATSAVAQTRPAAPAGAKPTPTPAATAPATGAPAATQATVALPMSKLAVIYTDEFMDPKTGIAKFTSVLNKLNGEFQKPKDEITAMQNRAQALEAEITKLRDAPAGTPIDQSALQSKADQLEQLKKDIQRRAEDAQAAYNKRRNELFQPLQIEIGTALEAFAKARGINVVVDGAQVPLLYFAESTNITRAFIAEFNSKNPVTAATSTTP